MSSSIFRDLEKERREAEALEAAWQREEQAIQERRRNEPEIIYASEWYQGFGSECKEYLGMDTERFFYCALEIGDRDGELFWRGPYDTRAEAEEELAAAYERWDKRVGEREEAWEAEQIARLEGQGDLLRIQLARSCAEDLEIDASVDGEYYDNRPEPLIPKGYLVPGVERVPAEMQAEIDRARTVGQVEHERQARQFAREQEIPYSSPLEDRVQELREKIKSLDEDILVHAAERRSELRNDPTVDQSKVGDLLRIELAQLRSLRDRLYSELERIQGRQLTQEHGLER